MLDIGKDVVFNIKYFFFDFIIEMFLLFLSCFLEDVINSRFGSSVVFIFRIIFMCFLLFFFSVNVDFGVYSKFICILSGIVIDYLLVREVDIF